MAEGEPQAPGSPQQPLLHGSLLSVTQAPSVVGSCSDPGPRLPDWAAPSCKVCCCSGMVSGSCNNGSILKRGVIELKAGIFLSGLSGLQNYKQIFIKYIRITFYGDLKILSQLCNGYPDLLL